MAEADPQFFLSLFLYLALLIVFYFKGLKEDGNSLTIFITIALYIFNLIWFYKQKSVFKIDTPKMLIQIILFYLLNILLLYTYFDPFNKAVGLNTIGNKTIITDYKPIIFSFITIVGFIGILVYSILSLTSKSTTTISQYYKTMLQLIGVIVGLVGMIGITIYFLMYTPWLITIISSILNIFIIILTLSVIKSLLKSTVKSRKPSDSLMDDLFNLLKAFIFYLPCLFIKFIEYIKKEYNLTTKTTVIILIIEAIIIGLRFLLPYLYNLYFKYFVIDGTIIEKGPIYLNTEQNLGPILNKKTHTDALGEKIKEQSYNYNYAISTWIWINPQSSSTNISYNKSTSLFNYGNILKINFNKNAIEFIVSTTKNGETKDSLVKIYKTKDFYYQKWNNILVNSSGGTLDIFINNKLVSSSINITPIIQYNNIIAGSDNGIHGGIKNIVYYDTDLSRDEISAIYSRE